MFVERGVTDSSRVQHSRKEEDENFSLPRHALLNPAPLSATQILVLAYFAIPFGGVCRHCQRYRLVICWCLVLVQRLSSPSSAAATRCRGYPITGYLSLLRAIGLPPASAPLRSDVRIRSRKDDCNGGEAPSENPKEPRRRPELENGERKTNNIM